MASRNLGSLTVDLVLKLGGFRQGMDAAARETQKSMAALRNNINVTAQAFKVAGTVIAGALTYAVKSAIDRADEMRDMAQAVGVSTEALSRLAYAGKQSGVEMEQISKALSKLAADGATDANAELMRLADVFAAMPDSSAKTALAIDKFGQKLGPYLIPLLNEGSEGLRRFADESDRIGNTISTTAADAADKFNDSIGKLKATVAGAANLLAAELLPSLNAVAAEFDKASASSESMRPAIESVANVLRGIATAAVAVGIAFDTMGKLIGASLATLYAIGNFDFRAVRQIALDFGTDATASTDAFFRLRDAIYATQKAADSADVSLSKLSRSAAIGRGSTKGRFDDATGQWVEFGENINRVRTKSSPRQFSAGANTAATAAARAQADALEAQARAYEDIYTKGKQAIDGLRTPVEDQIAQYHEAKFALEELARTYPNMAEEAAAALARLEEEYSIDEIQITAQEIFPKKEREQLSEFWREASRNVQDILADFIFDPFAEGLDGLFKSFAQMLQRMAAEAVAADIAGKLFGTGGMGSGGGWLGGLFGLFGGGGTTVPMSSINPYAFGLAGGGYTGDGGKYEPAGIVHRGEHVTRSEVVRQPGALPFLEAFNRVGMQALQALPGFAAGGFVGGMGLDAPLAAATVPRGTSGGVTINQQFTVNAPAGTVSRATEQQIAAAAARGAARASRRNN